ncbi:MAG: cyclase family protein [Verrucomicrobiales bacterium]|nr:cyclase family protein [Verrucomicrobiales bacterium]
MKLSDIHQPRRNSPMNKLTHVVLLAFFLTRSLSTPARPEEAGKSPWGAEDEIGALNLMTPETRLAILSRVSSGRTYDLGVEYFVGMPSFHGLGDPGYQYWLTHTPRGTVVDDPNGLGPRANEKVSYTGDAISMYTHMGTHIDALNHFGLHGKIWNGYAADRHLGDKGWKKAGAETIPPIIARGVLIDVAAYKGVDAMTNRYRITSDDLKGALHAQGVRLVRGDVVLIRTGQARHYHDASKYLDAYPGVGLEAVRWLVDRNGAMLLGADNLSLEALPAEGDDNWVPVHTYLLAERGVMFVEQLDLEELSRDRVYEFAFVAASLKLRGASGSPMRPIALPVRP